MPALIASAKDGRAEWLVLLRQSVEDVRHDMLMELIKQQMAAVLRSASPQELDGARRLTDLGIDSLMALELRVRLSQALGLTEPLSATLVYDYPTIEHLARFLRGAVPGLGRPASVPAEASPSERQVEISEMTDEQAEDLLIRRLRVLQGAS